jgi:hypothetical protein
MTTGHLAELLFTWSELDVLAGLVDERLAGLATADPAWSMLNSLRTALREAQQFTDVDREGST